MRARAAASPVPQRMTRWPKALSVIPLGVGGGRSLSSPMGYGISPCAHFDSVVPQGLDGPLSIQHSASMWREALGAVVPENSSEENEAVRVDCRMAFRGMMPFAASD